jgi:pimeloyl-ACP methyl ester carboxylesterase
MFGHGESTGRFEDGGPSRWRDDAVLALDKLTQGRQVIIGSSMGGWIMLLTALARPQRIAALIGIAAAPDFTEDLFWDELDETERNAMMTQGYIDEPGEDGSPPMRLSLHLVEDGRENMILGAPIAISCPVSLLHGQRDNAVPWQRALDIAACVTSDEVRIHLVKDGDHRLSRPQDLALLTAEVDRLVSGA